MKMDSSDRVQFGPFEADLHTHELWKHGTRIKLVGQPFEILAILLGKPGELVTREELRDRLWPGDTFVDFNHGLNAAVNRLREALCDSAEAPRYVETLPRRGYRFIATVERKASQTPVPPASHAEEPAVIPDVPPPPAPSVLAQSPEAKVPCTPKWRRNLQRVAVGVLLLIIFTTAHMVRKLVLGKQDSEVHSPVQRIRSLTGLADSASEPAFSWDGNYVAFRREGVRVEDAGIAVKATGSDRLVQQTSNFGDCCPVWSPDGRSIAFSRMTDKESGIYIVPASLGQESPASGNLTVALGGRERKLDTSDVAPKRGEMDWSPDGKTIAFSGGFSIFLLSLDTSAVRRLTEAQPLSEDWGPTFSPDGQRVLFVRRREDSFQEAIMAISTQGGEVRRITSEPGRIMGPPRWSGDGQSVIYGSDRGSHPALWRVSVDGNESPVQINDAGMYPAVSRKGYHLAYQRITRSLNIWQLDLSAPGEQPHILVPSTSETDQGPGPQFSPDGKKLAFMSDRSGSMEIWVSDRDGSNPFQLTAVGGAGTPRWSPDSESIAFDAKGKNGTAVFAVGLKGDSPRLLAPDDFSGRCPSWSQDGKWIYFASEHSGGFQVWKVPAEGGAPVQLTTQGGYAALASLDGKSIYYAKGSSANPEIWQVPVDGGPERLLSPLVRPATWASWSVVEKGIVFAGPSGNGKPAVRLFDFATHRVTDLAALDAMPFWLGATRDGQTLVFDQPESQRAQIMLVENFR